MDRTFNVPASSLLFATPTDYGKAEIQSVDNEKVSHRLVELMYNPRDGVLFNSGEEFMVILDLILHEFCPYDHGNALVQLYTTT